MPRLFTAIRPPPAMIDALFDTMEGVENARWQDEDQLHLTLTFLGDVPDEKVEGLAWALSRLDFAPFPVTLAGVGHFEHKGRVHSIWAGVVPSPGLVGLQQWLAAAGERAGVPAERRRFVPHVTLARFSQASRDVPGWLARHGTLRLEPFMVTGYALYESHLSHGPARYEEIAGYPAVSA